LVCILLGFNLFWSVIMWNMVVCILSYSFGLFSISILCTGNLISMCVITRESTIVLQLSPGSPLLYYSYHQGVHYCITVITRESTIVLQLSTCRLVFTLVTFLSTQCRLILFLIRVLSLFVKVIQLRFVGCEYWVFFILSISGDVLSSNWNLALVLVHSRTRCF
jgi:hypothetical protein